MNYCREGHKDECDDWLECDCRCHDDDDFDADELGLDPEEEYDA